MKKLINLSLEERLEKLEQLTNNQANKLYGGNTGNQLGPTPTPQPTIPPVVSISITPMVTSWKPAFKVGDGGGEIEIKNNGIKFSHPIN